MSKGSNKLLKMYTTLLKNHYTLVQSTQTGLIMSMGDVLAQTVENKTLKKTDLLRTSRFFMLGMVLVGPAASTWYKILAKTFGDGGTTVALKKVAADQLVFAPVFMATFMAALNTLQGKSLKQLKELLNAKYLELLIDNYKIWPAVQLINFYIVPLSYQVLFVQTIAIFWNAFISWKLAQDVKD